MSSATEVLQALQKRNLKLAIAESLTGGALSAEFVSVAGASKTLLGSIVAYQTILKHELLGVSNSLLEQQGAVDPEVAAQMAAGVRAKLAAKSATDEAQVVGISTTGVAGPDEQDGQPVGRVYVSVSAQGIGEVVYAHEFDGDRADIRAAAVEAAIDALWEHFG